MLQTGSENLLLSMPSPRVELKGTEFVSAWLVAWGFGDVPSPRKDAPAVARRQNTASRHQSS